MLLPSDRPSYYVLENDILNAGITFPLPRLPLGRKNLLVFFRIKLEDSNMVEKYTQNRSGFSFCFCKLALEKIMEPYFCWSEQLQMGVTGCSEEVMKCVYIPSGRSLKFLC